MNKEEEEILALKQKIHELTEELRVKTSNTRRDNLSSEDISSDEIVRFSRQILVPEFGKEGQQCLKNARVLVVGAGGLGCPCLTYLAAAGVGEITIVDYDVVEVSNLHRQILHNENSIGRKKVDSAKAHLQSLNSATKINAINMHLNSDTTSNLFNKQTFNVVIDGSDNVATRYLLNDICVMHNIPLVSGSALQMEGQLTVYNHKGSLCYRCLFPKPPPPETVTSCGDGGVLGPVPGVIGVLQALETIKILSNHEKVLSGRLLLFDGRDLTFRTVNLRKKDANCAVCSNTPTITKLIDYEEFCGASAHDKVVNISILNPEDHVDANVLKSVEPVKLIDVRSPAEFNMCHLQGSTNVPLNSLKKGGNLSKIETLLKSLSQKEVYVLCRRGNDSQRAIAFFKENFENLGIKFYNVKGGLHNYAKKVDNSFPVY